MQRSNEIISSALLYFAMYCRGHAYQNKVEEDDKLSSENYLYIYDSRNIILLFISVRKNNFDF